MGDSQDLNQTQGQQTVASDVDQHELLESVKNRALKELTSVLPQATNFDPEHRFDIYMSVLQSSGDAAMANSALDTALLIEDPSKRAEALSELVDEVAFIEKEFTK